MGVWANERLPRGLDPRPAVLKRLPNNYLLSPIIIEGPNPAPHKGQFGEAVQFRTRRMRCWV